MPNQLLWRGEESFGSSLCRESVSSSGLLQCVGLEAQACVPGSALPRTSFLSHFLLIFSFSKVFSHLFAHHIAPHNHDVAWGLGTTTTRAKLVRGGNWFAVQWLLWFWSGLEGREALALLQEDGCICRRMPWDLQAVDLELEQALQERTGCGNDFSP